MGIIADIFGGNQSKKAEQKAAAQAAAASQAATDRSIAAQQAMFDKIWGAGQGARDLGDSAIAKLAGLNNGTVNALDFAKATPGYQVGLDAGQRQLNASLAAKGGLLSGDAAREGLRYGQDYATGTFNTERNALLAAAGLGQTALNTGANVGQNTTNQTQNALFANANTLGQSAYRKADATSGFWGTVSGAIGQNALAGMAGKFLGF